MEDSLTMSRYLDSHFINFSITVLNAFFDACLVLELNLTRQALAWLNVNTRVIHPPKHTWFICIKYFFFFSWCTCQFSNSPHEIGSAGMKLNAWLINVLNMLTCFLSCSIYYLFFCLFLYIYIKMCVQLNTMNLSFLVCVAVREFENWR